jgi:hypothetical protein
MRLISWNVQWCRGMNGRVDPKRIAAEARRLADPDVICLQELARNFPDMEGSAGEDDLLFAEPLLLQVRLSLHVADSTSEPYYFRGARQYALTFKRRRDGVAREYLYGWDQTGGRSGEVGIKSYTADKVQAVEITEESFEPRYPIELTKAGQYFGKPFFTGSPGPRSSMRRPSSRSPYSYGGMEYRVECPYCGKTFKRSKWGDTKLNEHKDQYGNRCYGRVGHMVY